MMKYYSQCTINNTMMHMHIHYNIHKNIIHNLNIHKYNLRLQKKGDINGDDIQHSDTIIHHFHDHEFEFEFVLLVSKSLYTPAANHALSMKSIIIKQYFTKITFRQFCFFLFSFELTNQVFFFWLLHEF